MHQRTSTTQVPQRLGILDAPQTQSQLDPNIRWEALAATGTCDQCALLQPTRISEPGSHVISRRTYTFYNLEKVLPTARILATLIPPQDTDERQRLFHVV